MDESDLEIEDSSIRVNIINEENTRINSSPNDETENEIENNLVIFGKEINMTKTQLIAIFLLSMNFLLSASFYSLFAPFLPSEALKKEITQSEVGVIFGVYELVVLILSPIFGKYLQILGLRFLFVSGLFLSSGSQLLYAVLELCPKGTIYFLMSVSCRIVTGIGASMSLSYAIVGFYFPNKVSSLVAMLEVFNGLGYMLGPVVGGFLFQLGGFKLPFFFMGGLTFIIFVISLIIFPDVASQPTSNNRNGTKALQTLPFLPLFKIPMFIISLLLILMASISIGFFQPTIELHLAPLNLKPVQLGSLLLCPSLLYIICSPILGHYCDKYPKIIPFSMFLSGLILSVSFSFFGPIPYYHIPLNLWYFAIAFTIYGISIGGLAIPSYSEITNISIKHGYPNDLRLQGLISGIFSSIWSLGALLGPILGGIGCDKLGFELASFYLVIALLVVTILYGISHCCCSCTNQIVFFEQNNDLSENTPLLA